MWHPWLFNKDKVLSAAVQVPDQAQGRTCPYVNPNSSLLAHLKKSGSPPSSQCWTVGFLRNRLQISCDKLSHLEPAKKRKWNRQRWAQQNLGSDGPADKIEQRVKRSGDLPCLINKHKWLFIRIFASDNSKLAEFQGRTILPWWDQRNHLLFYRLVSYCPFLVLIFFKKK